MFRPTDPCTHAYVRWTAMYSAYEYRGICTMLTLKSYGTCSNLLLLKCTIFCFFFFCNSYLLLKSRCRTSVECVVYLIFGTVNKIAGPNDIVCPHVVNRVTWRAHWSQLTLVWLRHTYVICVSDQMKSNPLLHTSKYTYTW